MPHRPATPLWRPWPLAPHVLRLDEGVAEALAGLGLRDLGDCLRLPREGLARRFGPVLLSLLDRALGRQPDPRVPFEPPARFERVLDLPHEVDPDHRPEAAWRFCPPGEAGVSASRRRRPLWLLAEPRALVVREGWPELRGPLELSSGSERIEAGWWDGHPIARDYVVARNPEGGCYWVFREGHCRWFVHGIFG